MRHIAAATLSAVERAWPRPPRSSRTFSVFNATVAVALVGACTVATPPVVSTDGGPLATGQTITLASLADDASERERQLHSALRDEFAKQGYSMSEKAAYTIEYSITERSASVGIAHEPARGKNSGPEIVSPDRIDRRIFRECNAQRLRINLVAYPSAEGGSAKRASGEIDDCEFSNESVRAVVAAMVDALSAG